jgi:hypothetical protein
MIGRNFRGAVRFAFPTAAAACAAAGLWILLGGTVATPGRAAVAPSKTVEAPAAPVQASAPLERLSFGAPRKQAVTKAIEHIAIFDRVLGTNPQLSDADRHIPEPDLATWRVLRLRMTKASGKLLHIKLARPLAWIEQVGAREGGSLDMDLPEMGAVGIADVLAIHACPPLKPGPGNVVTGTFAHEADNNLITLKLSDDIDPIGVTDNHPFWSEDRRNFIPSGDLKPGERVRTRSGTAEVSAVARRPLQTGERVYNLEVHSEHVYQVTFGGVLVHNSCAVQAYEDGGGHHVFAKKAFQGVQGYNANKALAIPASEIARLGLNHLDSGGITQTQRTLFSELASSGRLNTLGEHATIAIESLVAGGLPRSDANSVVANALKQLLSWGITGPSGIPWN